ncbi:MAG: hypothetical protein M0Q94_16255 [Candidatus Cloacimonetes bacterium]|nr:hypothetical protein [Candidatus Cloacimonadota bacterium]
MKLISCSYGVVRALRQSYTHGLRHGLLKADTYGVVDVVQASLLAPLFKSIQCYKQRYLQNIKHQRCVPLIARNVMIINKYSNVSLRINIKHQRCIPLIARNVMIIIKYSNVSLRINIKHQRCVPLIARCVSTGNKYTPPTPTAP